MFYSDMEENIQKLTRDDVLAALKKYIKPERLNIVAAGDFNKEKKESSEK